MSARATSPETGSTSYTTRGEREIVIRRDVAAPRRRVFDAWTRPEDVRRWLLGPGWEMPSCEIDLRPGGAWRYVWRKASGALTTVGGTFEEVLPPERLVTVERWGPEWPETRNTLVLSEREGRTSIELTVTYPSRAARDDARGPDLQAGMDPSFARLDALLAGPD